MISYFKYDTSFKDKVTDMCMRLYEEDPEGESMDAGKIGATLEHTAQHPEQIGVTVLAEDAEVIGYAILVPFYSNEFGGVVVHIDELYIMPEYRNRGIATEFINSLKTDSSYVGVALETTPSNAEALKLYKSLGFQPSENMHMFVIAK